MPAGGVDPSLLARPLAERFYRWFARNRYKFGCGEHCQFRPQDVDFGADA